jgi:23S rRNA pseudouridine1911/1915/1917 synthase
LREVELNLQVPNSQFRFIIADSDADKRLDVFLTEKLEGFSRSQLQKIIQNNKTSAVLINTANKKPNYLLKRGDIVEVNIPEPEDVSLQPLKIDLDVLYEDQDILVINKQPGIPVHPSAGHRNDTIVNALLYYLQKNGSLSNIGGEKRPGIIHRLDKDTAGVMVIAKNNSSHLNIAKQFAQRKIKKIYETILKGRLTPPEGTIDRPIARNTRHRKKFTVAETGRQSVTGYRVIDSKNDSSWVEFRPITGRTHQLRVHALSLGHPIVGDPIYSRKSNSVPFLALVARSLSFHHPKTDKLLKFTAAYPAHFRDLGISLGYKLE